MMLLVKKYAESQANLRIQPFKKDWNKDYQAILSEADSEQKFKKLYHLAHDFVYAANTYPFLIRLYKKKSPVNLFNCAAIQVRKNYYIRTSIAS
jgi:predicted ArsR family transcriptional regulator